MSSGTADAMLPAGFTFVRGLGQGTTGHVVLARQASLDRLVAVKLIHTRDAETEQRLRREGMAIAALVHPHIVRVHQLLRGPSGLALVMDYVAGGDLGAPLRAGAISVSAGATLLRQIADALDYAVAHGVTHRDVKPANVLLTEDGQAKLADFGLARMNRSDVYRTIASVATGTPAYMAPEQITDPDTERAASDVYALTVLAYELLLGARPYVATDMPGIVNAHLHAAPIPPEVIRAGVPAALRELLLAGLEKDPQRRPTAGQFAACLAAVADDEWSSVGRSRVNVPRPTADWSRGVRPRRSPQITRRTVVMLIAVLVGVVVGLALAIAATH